MRMSSKHHPEEEERGIEPTHSAISGRVVSGGLWTLPQIGTDERKMKGERRGKKEREEVNGLLNLRKYEIVSPQKILIWQPAGYYHKYCIDYQLLNHWRTP